MSEANGWSYAGLPEEAATVGTTVAFLGYRVWDDAPGAKGGVLRTGDKGSLGTIHQRRGLDGEVASTVYDSQQTRQRSVKVRWDNIEGICTHPLLDLYPADGPLPPLPTGIEYGVPMTYTSSEQVGHLAPGVVCYAVAPMMAAMFEDTGQTYVKVAGGLSAKPWRSAMLVHASAVEKAKGSDHRDCDALVETIRDGMKLDGVLWEAEGDDGDDGAASAPTTAPLKRQGSACSAADYDSLDWTRDPYEEFSLHGAGISPSPPGAEFRAASKLGYNPDGTVATVPPPQASAAAGASTAPGNGGDPGQCEYNSAGGKQCNRKRVGASAQCTKHTCTIVGCSKPKSSKEDECEEHADADDYGYPPEAPSGGRLSGGGPGGDDDDDDDEEEA